MISAEAEKITYTDPCCVEEAWESVSYTMRINRRPFFYIINYIFPSVLINAVGCMVFYVPCDSGEKVSLGISAMLSMVVFLMTTTYTMPPATSTPLLSVYYCACIAIVALEVFFSIVVLNVHHRGRHGEHASDVTISVAAVMARLTFTQLRDPTGHLSRRRACMAARVRDICGWKPPATNMGGRIFGVQKNMGGRIFGVQKNMGGHDLIHVDPTRANQPRVSLKESQPKAELRKPRYTEADDLLAAKFGIPRMKGVGGAAFEGFEVLGKIHSLLHAEYHFARTENELTRVAETFEKAIETAEKYQSRNCTSDNKRRVLKSEFAELARIYDRFFLALSIVGTILTSAGILLSTPNSTAS